MNFFKYRGLGIVFMVAVYSNFGNAQVSNDSVLFKSIKARDSLLFEVGYNTCALEVFDELLPESFEFYHDKVGVVSSKEQFINSLRTNICNPENNNVKRVLDKESMEVFPLYNNGNLYGAIQSGKHSFGSTIARFTTLWLLEHEKWIPSRIMSYDHKSNTLPIVSNVEFIRLSYEELSIYSGEYQFSPDFTLSIIVERDRIFGVAQGQKVELYGYGQHKFLDGNQAIKLHFILDDNGICTGLKMISRDREQMAERN